MKKISLIILFVFTISLGFSQGNGTTFNGINECNKRTYSVSIHILTDTTGKTNVSNAAILLGLTNANLHFDKICATFKICSTYVHPNVRNDHMRANIEDNEIAQMYDVPNTINIYYAEDLIGGISPCGYAPLGGMSVPTKEPMRDAIFMKKSCAASAALTHELGHYFGLYHTFEQAVNGVELVNGTNCATAGDLICDTPPDPSSTAKVDGFCDLLPADVDANGDFYTPNACNIMSYIAASCIGERFTIGQYNRMLEVMEKGRNYLW